MGKWNYRPSRRFFPRRRSPNPPPIFYDIKATLPEIFSNFEVFRERGIAIEVIAYAVLHSTLSLDSEAH
ncbi:hypothetical protein TSUD_119560 [Trifolium subterraneum]|uniref:Uncharacterized protein n=1 Tax=Trifolium subterraneum TaxID=3900 RepID=A0A2Z6NQW8_TRISU|nr:hypothetical protein TSUD_119560 [Trifolium subterraneum]